MSGKRIWLASEGGYFGEWATDAFGLPCFDVRVQTGRGELVLPDRDARRMWHQVGNDRVTAIAHMGGWTNVYFADRGFARWGGARPEQREQLGGMWRCVSGSNRWDCLSPTAEVQTRWGMGYAEWDVRGGPFEVRRRVWTPFGDLPAVCVDVEVGALASGSYEERWPLHWYPFFLGLLMSRWTPPPPHYNASKRWLWRTMFAASSAMRWGTERLRQALGRRLEVRFLPLDELSAPGVMAVFHYRGPFRPRSPEAPSFLDGFPKSLFFLLLSGQARLSNAAAPPAFVAEATLEKGHTDRFRFALGCGERAAIGELVAELGKTSLESTAARWKEQLHVVMPEAPWLARELEWHGYYLRSAQVRDDYFEATVLPQGSAYGFVHGLHGAIRDSAIATVPLIFLHPPSARDNLRLMMRMTAPDGSMFYGYTGYGKCVSVGVHKAPTDLQLFFLWALSEYVWATGDHAFLEELVPFYPKHLQAVSTVGERVRLAWRYVRDRVGCGEHGMLRVGSGDWSDPISMMVRNRFAFRRRGESGFNTAMALYVLPRAADLLTPTDPQEAEEIRAFVERLRAAMERAWTGRWFLRGWDGQGRPLGEEHLFLDANVWALIAKVGDARQRSLLVGHIHEKLDEPSPIGAWILDRPHPVRGGALPEGWDCNGGVWAAINGLLTWAYALHDVELAWRSLQKQSLACHARTYPHVWYGIWSGPDAYNADYAHRPGETFVHPATPMAEFPVMNSNAHAAPLLALLRLVGIETEPDGIRIQPRLVGRGAWSLRTPLLQVEWDGSELRTFTASIAGLAVHPPERGA